MSESMFEMFDRLHETMQTRRASMMSEPTKEVRLLRVLKEFRPAAEHEKIDRVIDAMMLADTFQVPHGAREARETRDVRAMREARASVHADGVYDVDRSCAAGKKPAEMQADAAGLMLMMMALMGRK